MARTVRPLKHGRDDLRTELLCGRYLRKDDKGRVVETINQMLWRVALAVARAEKQERTTRAQIRGLAKQFLQIMKSGRFLPNSPTLMNAGRTLGVLSACFVLPIDDSIEAIFESVKDTAKVQRAGGGTGFSFDRLRPTGDFIASSGGRTSGPISFWRVFSEATRAIQQGAFRRGANMGMMSIGHPDILKFITAKSDLTAFENFNVSVKIPDEFMRCLAEDPGRPHEVVNPRNGDRYVIPKSIDLATYSIQDLLPASKPSRSCYSVRDIWDMIVRCAHATGEPGASFIDRMNANNPTPLLGRIEATNPCGEQGLLPNESCNLASINVSKFVIEEDSDLDWPQLRETIRLAVTFLDNTVSISTPDLPAIEEAKLRTRKIGLGIMGFADALILLGIRYDSKSAVEWAERISSFLTDTAHKASEELARVRGNFPAWPGSIWDTRHRPMRNAACTTIAPTGSISIIAGCSGGIEPIYALASQRTALDGRKFVSVHPLLERLGKRDGWLNHRVRRELLGGKDPKHIRGFPDRLAGVLVTSHDVAPEWHVRIQAAFQENIDNAVSKTVNLPASAGVEDVDRIFRLAYELGCKGCTVYLDGSRAGQTLTSAATSGDKSPARDSLRARPRVTRGRTFKFRMGCGTLYVTTNHDEHGALCEVFSNLGKAGGCASQSEAACRAVSAGLRSGVKPEILIEQLKGIRCQATSVARKGNSEIDVLSCPDAIARALEESSRGRRSKGAVANAPRGRRCPVCGATMRRESGCFVCDACKYNSCG
jgi:ribonucleoside-diphosphate reductase alpha chain